MRRLSVVAALAGAALACSDTTETPTVASVTVAPASADLAVGASLAFTATPLDAGGTPVADQQVTWTINDPTVATLSATGTATGVEPGIALVRATVNGIIGQARLEVVAGPPAVVQIQPESSIVDIGAFRTFEGTVRDAAGNLLTEADVTWSSSAPAIGTITAEGILSGSAAGNVLVIATSGDAADTVPVQVLAVALSATAVGGAHTCGASTGRSIYCWGNAANGVLGNAATAGTVTAPALALSGAELVRASAGPTHTCGIDRAGIAYCWGRNNRGQVGDGSTITRSIPTFVVFTQGFSMITVGGEHTCALTLAGSAYCWGRNEFGQIGQDPDPEPGIGQSPPPHPIPLRVQSSPAFASVTTGRNHSCALTPAGAAWCWGDGRNGALGDGSRLAKGTPVPVSGGLTFTALNAGSDYTCGIASGGAAYCWGRGTVGQLGTGDTLHLTPAPVTGGQTFATISAGSTHTCALTGTGAAYCWGTGTNGQLGTGTTTSSPSPVAVSGGLTFDRIGVSLATTGGHSCGTTAANVAYCWGLNSAGQLGDGTTSQRTVPTRVSGQ